jgi:hypothetical protein
MRRQVTLADPTYDDPEMATRLDGCGVCADDAQASQQLRQDAR